ncbi:sarcosine oxidase [Fusarium longipes]|uniref:Sarcosine oxidase n=1 Tax=Fusarium longipes TaxID=694270 RepID=A0A395T492_9HYPO|nr:sarcosine oxidase [Fusarium longipes]
MSDTTESVIIVGSGIVGSSLAYFLSSTSRNITIIDRSFTSLLGSSGIAPGFIGQFNESEILTKLAIDSVSEYVKVPGGFDRVGGLEIAFQDAGIERLHTRCKEAKKLGLPAAIMTIEEAHSLAPDLVNASGAGSALFFQSDGTANAVKLTTWYQDEARKHGINFVEADVEQLAISGGRITGVSIRENGITKQLNADKVILTTGIWAQSLTSELDFPVPVIPVGHPYMHGQTRDPLPHSLPFVRWPEHHVYARDHGTNYGIGSYDHAPIGQKPGESATGEWVDWFKQPLKFATGLLPPDAAAQFKDSRKFNGVFSMTPDNMPLAGKIDSVDGLYTAVAVWVTHAAGCAKFLVDVIDGKTVDSKMSKALDPERFRGQDFSDLEEKSLQGYNSIYKTYDESSVTRDVRFVYDVGSSTGRKCDGYQASPSPKSHEASPTSIVSTYANSINADLIQFFVEKTLDDFQTFFPDNLWSTKILQIAHTEDCIKNGVMALSHFHRLYLTHQQWQQVDPAPALKHYNLAIKTILCTSNDITSQGHVLVLSCIIFICIELLQGKTESAISLFRYGCSMIQQYRKTRPSTYTTMNSPCTDAEETFRLAEACLKRIAVQFLTVNPLATYQPSRKHANRISNKLVADIDPSLWFLFYNTFGSNVALQTTTFTSLADAREALLEIIVEQASPGLKNKSARDIIAHSAKVTRWGELFDALLVQLNDSEKLLSDAERRSIALLQLHRKYLEINVAKYAYGRGDPCFWDKFIPEFDEIVRYAATAAGLEQDYTRRNWCTDSSQKAYFHIDLGFTSVLISVIARCRDPFVRRRAIAVMLADRVQEGAFSGSESARVGARVMELEEARSGKEVKCSSDIPQEARVRTIRVHLAGEEERIRLVYGFSKGCVQEVRSMTGN